MYVEWKYTYYSEIIMKENLGITVVLGLLFVYASLLYF